ncbi:hypothetical protein [Bacteroides stercoris]|nr:hypothetical protein [Bacteroides stercoris]
MKPYDYLIVGSGLFGAVFAHEAHKAGKNTSGHSLNITKLAN